MLICANSAKKWHFWLFSKQLAVNEKDQCRKEMLRFKPRSSQYCSLAIRQSGDTRAQKTCKNKKKLFGPNSFLIPAKIETGATFLEVQALQWENDFNCNFLKKNSESNAGC